MNNKIFSPKKILVAVGLLAVVVFAGWFFWTQILKTDISPTKPASKTYFLAEISMTSPDKMTLKSVTTVKNNNSISPDGNDSGKLYYARLIKGGQEMYHTNFRVPMVIGEELNPNTGVPTNRSMSPADTQVLTFPDYGRGTSLIITDENSKVLLNEPLSLK